MLIEKLEPGSMVILEIASGDKRFEITSKVIGCDSNCVYVEFIKAGKELLQIDKNMLNSAVYNLYADDFDGKRVGWKNVTIGLTDYSGKKCFGIYTRSFNKNSTYADRRDNERIKVGDVICRVETSDGEDKDVLLNDISNNGISFTSSEDNFLNKRLIIHFNDIVNSENYDLSIHCICVRRVVQEDTILFGCNIVDDEKKFLSYIFKKKLALKKIM